MIDAQSIDLITQQIIRDGRSLLQYVGESAPYTPADAVAASRRADALAREEQVAVGKLIRFLHRQHVTPPFLGAFPSAFTTINFTSLEHLLPALRKDAELAIAALEHGLATLPESAARHLLWDYLEMKRHHLHALQDLAHGDTPPVPPVPAAAQPVH